jgi:hypothetical protein
MFQPRFEAETEEAFVLASLKEFVKLWGSGGHASFQLQCSNRQASFHLSSQHGAPADRHFLPSFPRPKDASHGFHDIQPHPQRQKSLRQRERDRARAAAHRATKDLDKGKQAVTAETESALTTDPHLPPNQAAPAVHISAPQDPAAPDVSLSQNEGAPPAQNPLIKEAVTDAPNFPPNEDAPADHCIQPTKAAPAAPSLSSNPTSSSSVAPRQQVQLAAVPAVYAAGCPPQVVAVYATAVFENCPTSQLEQEDLESLQRFLTSENHLKQNISEIKLKELSSRSFRNNVYTHTLSVELHIATFRLCEPQVNYIRRNLEKSEWKRSNGTLIGLNRIHS